MTADFTKPQVTLRRPKLFGRTLKAFVTIGSPLSSDKLIDGANISVENTKAIDELIRDVKERWARLVRDKGWANAPTLDLGSIRGEIAAKAKMLRPALEGAGQAKQAATEEGPATEPSEARGDGGPLDELAAEGQESSEGGAGKKTTQVQELIALTSEVEFFHTSDDEPYASVVIDGRRETWPVSSRSRARGLRAWLHHKYYEAHGKPPSSQALADALEHLASFALFKGAVRDVYVRMAVIEVEGERRVYIDLADREGRAVEVTPRGVTVTTTAPVLFVRPRGILPLPEPKPGGSLEMLLRPLARNLTDDDFKLLIGWLIGAHVPTYPIPILVCGGPQGSGKSSLSRVAVALVDPNAAPLRRPPREEFDLMVTARHTWVYGMDNLSWLPAWMSDALCSLATGAGFGNRKYFSDDDVTLFAGIRPVVVNGIGEVTSRGDFVDRSIKLTCQAIPEDKRIPEKRLWADFYAARPLLLGALYSVLSQGLARLDSVTLATLPRMADFALLIAACEPALGWKTGTFARIYGANRDEAQRGTLDGSPVAQAVLDYHAANGDCTTSLKTLRLALREIAEGAEEGAARRKDWPKDERNLRIALERNRDGLRLAGVDVTFLGHSKRGSMVALRGVGKSPAPPSPPSPSPSNGHLRGDSEGDGGDREWSRPSPADGEGAVTMVTVDPADPHPGNPCHGAIGEGGDGGEGQVPTSLDGLVRHALPYADTPPDGDGWTWADGAWERPAPDGTVERVLPTGAREVRV